MEHEKYSFNDTFYIPKGIEEVHAHGIDLADRLLLGDTTALPEDTYFFMMLHTQQASQAAIREQRAAIIDTISSHEPHFSSEICVALGHAVHQLIATTNQEAALFIATDTVLAARLSIMFNPTYGAED